MSKNKNAREKMVNHFSSECITVERCACGSWLVGGCESVSACGRFCLCVCVLFNCALFFCCCCCLDLKLEAVCVCVR